MAHDSATESPFRLDIYIFSPRLAAQDQRGFLAPWNKKNVNVVNCSCLNARCISRD